jgi:hypothetical protein
MRKVYLAVSGLIVLISSSCKKEQGIPSYIYLEDIQASGVYTSNGSDSSKIYGAKVFLDNQIVGVYQTPVEFPVLATGSRSLKINALIEKNGFFDDVIPYPYYDLVDIRIELKENETVSVSPIVPYLESNNVAFWFEDFESPNYGFETDPESSSSLKRTVDESLVYEGSGSGRFDLDGPNATIFEESTTNFFYKTGSNTFVELHYKNNQNFFFGVKFFYSTGVTENVRFFEFTPSDNEEGEVVWNKIYLEIGSLLNSEPSASFYRIFFEVNRDPQVLNPEVYIDNVKVIRDI